MTFETREHSLSTGKPIRLYEFSRGALRWRYCSADRNVTYNTQVYQSLVGGITDNGLRFTGDPNADRLEITAPADLDVAEPWRHGLPGNSVGLVVYDMHLGDTDAVLSWTGRVSSIVWPDLTHCKIVGVSRDADLDDPGLTDCYTRLCSATLGDVRCGVSLASFRVEATIQSMDGSALTIPAMAAYPDGYFTAGYVEWPIGSGEYDRRFIQSHQTTQLQLLGGTYAIPVSAALRVYPGCDFLFSTCQAKFNNGDRFRAIPNLEGRSPFDGNSVW